MIMISSTVLSNNMSNNENWYYIKNFDVWIDGQIKFTLSVPKSVYIEMGL